MRALSIRQPWAELILRGTKTIECRSRPTRVRERIWIYAALAPARMTPLSGAGLSALPRGFIVGSVDLVGCRPLARTDSGAACVTIDFEGYAWILSSPERLASPRRPHQQPQPVFFYPFGRPR